MTLSELGCQRRLKCKGFTLLELLVVISITVILAGLAVPSFNSFVANQKIKSVSFDLLSTLIGARSEAMKRNASVFAAPADGANWQSGWTVKTGTVTLHSYAALTGMTVLCKPDASVATFTTTACPTITYNGSGRLQGSTSPAIQVTGASGGYRRCISLDLSGRPSSTKGSASGSATTWVCP